VIFGMSRLFHPVARWTLAQYDFNMPDLAAIRNDLAAEQQSLDDIVAGLPEDDWNAPTPAVGWSVLDQISHLAFFDEQARLAVTEAEAFAKSLAEIATDVGAFMARSIDKGRDLGAAGVLLWWRTERAGAAAGFEGLEPGVRIPWYGPPMSPASFVSARIMETWAHGQDVADALGVHREATPRLRNVAHIGVLARGYAYEANGMTAPEESVRVELDGPEGVKWTWNEDASASVTGDAYDFCLVVTRRRHPDDTDLVLEGDPAKEWMSIAQAYAGPPGDGRKPGQFTKRRVRQA
jgi:uncharacterized protein (TIGR03084 family)